MKKVARLRIMTDEQPNGGVGEQTGVRTTGRIKKPKAVFDPSDNYLPRSQRQSNVAQTSNVVTTTAMATASVGAIIGTGGVLEQRKRDVELLPPKRLSQSSVNSSNCTTVSLASPSLQADNCYICNKKEMKRGIGAKNKLISCIECDIKVHKMCLKVDFEDFDILRTNYKCDNCRSCVLCSAFADTDAEQEEEFVTCAKCTKSYHLTCHIPNVHKYQQHQKDWKCNKCSLPRIGNGNLIPVKTIREIIGDENISAKSNNTIKTIEKTLEQHVNIAAAAEEAKNSAAKRNSPVQKDTITETIKSNANGESKALENKRQKLEKPLTGKSQTVLYNPNEPFEIPDVKDWTVDQVTEFFVKYFPKEAHVFTEHEIDGMSLLLLKRSDVIKKLPFKLGPSLRIYSLILKIQTQLNDPTLAWNCGI